MPKYKEKKRFTWFYSQKELLALKEYLSLKLNSRISILYKYSNNPFYEKGKIEIEATGKFIREISEIQKILLRTKRIIAINNVLFGINSLIFKRELLTKKKHYLCKLTEGRNKGNKKHLFDALEKGIKIKKQKIEYIIDDVNRKLKKTEKKQNRINNIAFGILFTKSFILNEFNKHKRPQIINNLT